MKKHTILLFAALLAGGLAVPGFAQNEDSDTPAATVDEDGFVRGRVVSKDESKGQIVISPLSGGENKTFTVAPEQLAGFDIGDRVRVKYDPATQAVGSIQHAVYKSGHWYTY